MGRFFQYHAVSPTTWAYLSTLLMIGLFFKFNRFWSVRNLDLLLLSLLAPGLLLIHVGQVKRNPITTGSISATADPDATTSNTPSLPSPTPSETVTNSESIVPTPSSLPAGQTAERRGGQLERAGYIWLFVTGLLWFIRMLLDTRLTRRPLLSPNLSVGGMAFIGVSLFLFLSGNVIYRAAVVDAGETDDSVSTTTDLMNARMEQFLTFQQPSRGPGYAALRTLPAGATKTIAILSHLAVVLGLALVAYRHFGNVTNGIGIATLYLMVPYTSQLTGQIEHCLPAAFLVWAVFYYRRPLVSGLLLGGAVGCIYYPLFLLPLWASFYWKRGMFRFLVGVVLMLVILTVVLPFAPGSAGFAEDLQRMFGVLRPAMEGLDGLWNQEIGGWDSMYRLPVLATVAVFSCSLFLWPAQKNLGTLISCSASVMLCSQFWHGYGGGLFIAWYLPLALLMIFRPNLEDRVAQTMLSESIVRRRANALS